MTGKEKCTLLRQIRQEIAAEGTLLNPRSEPLDDRWLDESIAVLGLSERTRRNLMRANITRVKDLTLYTEEDLRDELILRAEDAAEAMKKLARYKKEVCLKEFQRSADGFDDGFDEGLKGRLSVPEKKKRWRLFGWF